MRVALLVMGAVCACIVYAWGKCLWHDIGLLQAKPDDPVANYSVLFSIMVTSAGLIGLLVCGVGYVVLIRLDELASHLH